jgi:hypothetical protein
MRSISSLSPYLIFLPLIGLIAFFLDSSFVAFRNFFPIYEEDVSRIYFINSIGCVIAVIAILYILFTRTKEEVKGLRSTYLMKYVFFVSQSVVIVFIIITLLQLQTDGTYSSVNIIALFSLSYGVGLYCIALLASKFFAWFRIGQEVTVLCYALTMCIFIVFLITSLLYAANEFSTNIYPSMTSGNIGFQVTQSNPLPSVYDTYFYYTYLLTFISVYLITLLSLRVYLKKIRRVFFYLLFSIPLIYFLLKVLPFSAAYIASLIMYSPTYYGTLYTLLFSGTGPLGGILFSLVLLAVSRRINNISVRNYLSISALGMLLFFIVNQNPPLQESLLPPFGIISKSFIGLSCYMILVGIYSSVTLLSRRNTLTRVVLKEVSKDRLFSSAVRSEHEIQVRGIINKNIDHIEAFPESEPKELSIDEVVELVSMVKKEISERKERESS